MLRSLSDNIRIDPDKCTFCGVCVETCILDNLRLQLAPCREACPLHTNCQGYVQLIARGKFDQALAVVREGLPFPGIIGRVCSHPCEDACHRNEVDGQPVAIRALKRFLDDHEEELQLDLSVPSPKSESVAIVGSGPGGMMAAWELRKRGYSVDIYEAASRPGGMLVWGIPEFRLPLDVVEREFGYLEEMGVRLHLNTEVGKDVSFQDLVAEYNAIFVATGAPHSARLDLEGEAADGVYHGLDFLRRARENPASLKVGRQVIIIGGGNVAVDAAQTALRLEGESVRLVCLETRQEMPAFEWEIEDAVAEGVELVLSQGPSRFIVENGHIRAVEFRTCTSVFDADGTFNPCYDEGERCTFGADTVIVAIGQKADPDFLGASGVETVDGWIMCDPITLQTSIEKVFAGGDAVTDPASVVEAMASGKAAAESIDRLLRGEDIAFGRDYLGPYILEFDVDLSKGTPNPRVVLPRSNGGGDSRFAELELSMTESQAVEEAGRCLSCGLPEGYYRTCWFCLPCEVECPEDALWVEIPYLLR